MRFLAALISLAIINSGFSQSLKISSPVKFLALGDSYTIGQSVAVADRWPVQLINDLRIRGLVCEDARIVAQTGWRTDNLSDAIRAAKLNHNYTLVGLLIGVNDFYQGRSVEEYQPGFESLLDSAIAFANGDPSHVFVVSIPDYGFTPFGQSNQPNISKGIDAFNAANKAITAGKLVPYFFITDISRQGLAEPDLVTTDGLHPSGKQYARWVETIFVGATITPDTTGNIVTGIKKEATNISIYPIPFNEKLNIEINDVENRMITFRLINMMGQIVINKAISSFDEISTLETMDISSGFYVYEFVSKAKVIGKGKIFK